MTDWSMDLSDHDPADEFAKRAATERVSMAVDAEGEPYEVPVPHEPTAESREAGAEVETWR